MGPLLFFLFLALLLSGVPIAVAIGLSSVAVIWLADLGIAVVSPNFYSGIAKFQLLAIPLFIFAGFLFERCGISERLVRFANLLVGRKNGSLAIVAVLVCVFFGGISGSGPADAAAIGAILIPAMIRDGYDRGFVAALIAGAGSTAIIVPVSIALIIYGALTNTSITTLFAAGAIPGALAGLCLILPAWWISKKRGYGSRTAMDCEMGLFRAFREAFWGLMAPAIILGGLYGGVFTPTEAAVVAVFYGLILGFFLYRTLTLKALYEILVEASNASAVVMLIITFAGLFSWTASTLGAMDTISASLLSVSDNPYVVLLVINIILFFAGMLIDAISIFYIFIPIFLPIMARFGWDPIWFGIMMTFNLAIGQFTPPVAVNLYVTTHLAEIPVEETFKAVLPLIFAMIIGLVILALFPGVTLFLPRLLGMS